MRSATIRAYPDHLQQNPRWMGSAPIASAALVTAILGPSADLVHDPIRVDCGSCPRPVWPRPAAAAQWIPRVKYDVADPVQRRASTLLSTWTSSTWTCSRRRLAMVRRVHDNGRHVVCYINAGAWENWRPDAPSYPSAVKGKPLDGWPGERWLDIRRLDVLGPILDDAAGSVRRKGLRRRRVRQRRGLHEPNRLWPEQGRSADLQSLAGRRGT